MRELLTSRVVFAVNRYECVMENKNKIRTFCDCKPSKKNNIEPHQNFTVFFSYKKREGSGITPKYTENISKSKKVNKLWQKLLE